MPCAVSSSISSSLLLLMLLLLLFYVLCASVDAVAVADVVVICADISVAIPVQRSVAAPSLSPFRLLHKCRRICSTT